MAGDFIPESELKLTGIQKYYNSFTKRGRFNVCISPLKTFIYIIDDAVKSFDQFSHGHMIHLFPSKVERHYGT